MATSRQPEFASGFAVSPDRPLIGIMMIEDGREVVRYFADEADADAAIAVLGWNEAIDELDRIRHESQPTPPIESL